MGLVVTALWMFGGVVGSGGSPLPTLLDVPIMSVMVGVGKRSRYNFGVEST